MKQDLKSMTLAEMQDAFAAIGEPKFRAKQVFTWLHRGAVSFDAMTNTLQASAREAGRAVRHHGPLRRAQAGLEARRHDQIPLEAPRRQPASSPSSCSITMAIPSLHLLEVGCPMGCKFCASTIGGLVRRLEPSELVDQVLFSPARFRPADLQHRALVGIGEPLDNFDNVTCASLELHQQPGRH